MEKGQKTANLKPLLTQVVTKFVNVTVFIISNCNTIPMDFSMKTTKQADLIL